MDVDESSTSYERWADAQQAVVEFEKAIFREGHVLTERELLRLQELRQRAAAHLRAAIDAIDGEFDRLHTRPDDPGAGQPCA